MLEIRTVVNFEEVTTNFYFIFAMRNTVHTSFLLKHFCSQCGPWTTARTVYYSHKNICTEIENKQL